VQDEGLAHGHGREPVLELVALAREDERRLPGQLSGDRPQLGGVGPVGLLGGLEGAPGVKVDGFVLRAAHEQRH
jgi:hypothetical protein